MDNVFLKRLNRIMLHQNQFFLNAFETYFS